MKLRAVQAWPGVLAAMLVFVAATPARAIVLPPGFTAEPIVTNAQFTAPTAMAFVPSPPGFTRMLVAEKDGIVWTVTNGLRAPTPLWDGHLEVLNDNDRGFIGLAVDPNFATTGWVFFLYTVDPDSNGVDQGYGFGRLIRLTLTPDASAIVPGSRAVLFGQDWTRGPLVASSTHTIGSIRFGRDGTLFAGAGEGAQIGGADTGGMNPDAFAPGRTDPSEDVGAFRSQLITSLCGKILRLDPATGHGLPSNPYWNGDPQSVRSRVWAYGLRNPFRFAVRGGTGSTNPADGDPGHLVIGDVGWDYWEEQNYCRLPGQNFGWPCYEGTLPTVSYATLPPPERALCDNLGTVQNPATSHSFPFYTTNHWNPSQSIPPGRVGNAAVAGPTYTGTLYPAFYQGQVFIADYGQHWIQLANLDAQGNLQTLTEFATDTNGLVDMALDPDSGDLVYVSIYSGQLFRIRYQATGSNTPPVAQASATPGSGVFPLAVQFSSAGTFDVDGDSLIYAWTFGDGGSSNEPNPAHTYLSSGLFTASLLVNDGHGGADQATVGIAVGTQSTFPTAGILDDFNRPDEPLAAPWTGSPGAMVVQDSTLQLPIGAGTVIFSGGPYGADQEAYVTLRVANANDAEVDLVLKAQGTATTQAHLEVRYDPEIPRVLVSAYAPATGWQNFGQIFGITYDDGDRFGARALASGLVEIYKNSIQVGQVSVSGWSFAASGGRVGLTCGGIAGFELDDFGGGTWVQGNLPPTVSITAPNGGEEWVAGTAHDVTWTATDDVGVTGVDIFYRATAAEPWTPIELQHPNDGLFNWFVPNTPGSDAAIKVVARDAANATGADSSDTPYSISRTPGGVVATTLRDFHMPGTQPFEAGSFTTSDACMSCHGGFNPAAEPGRNWQGSPMAQAARDPLFHACLAIAEQDAPSSGDMCIRCHSPFAWLSGRSNPTNGSRMNEADRDGVTCAFCHRMVDPVYKPGVSPPEDQAVLAMIPAHTPRTYSNGQYVIDPSTTRRGPYADAAAPHGFIASPFHRSSDLCGTCHDVSNPVFTRVGPAQYAAGPLDAPPDSISSETLMPLERTYSEWKHSAFPAGVYAPAFAPGRPDGMVSNCQDCHLRMIAATGCSETTAPFRFDIGLHDMMGGNAWIGGVIANLFPTETNGAALADAALRAISMLKRAATVRTDVVAEADSFRATVRVTNHTGHKLPTGYPEGRRMWLNVIAKDAGGNVLYESGAYDSTTGVLTEDPAIRLYEAHLGISAALAASTGLAAGPSFHFTLNDSIYKDNRIPPLGFTNDAYASFGGQPVDPGVPGQRYADGQNWDLATYALPAGTARVVVTLLYQTTSRSYVEFLRDQNTTNQAGQVLFDAWEQHGRAAPVVMARDSVVFTPVSAPFGTPSHLALRALSNPWRDALELALALPRAADVELQILDVSGRVVARVTPGRLPAGEQRLRWNGRDAAGRPAVAGVYWAVVRADDRRLVRRVVRVK